MLKTLEEFISKLEDNYSTHYQFGERYINAPDDEIMTKKKYKDNKLKIQHRN
jgi:hypothetical protein